MPCVLFEFATISFFFLIKNSGYTGDCEIIWKWWPVFILAVSYNILKITQSPKRERDWKQLGNHILILSYPCLTLKLYIPDTFLSWIFQKAVLSFTYQFNVFLMFCKILTIACVVSYLPNVILRTQKCIARVLPLSTKGK